MNKNKPGMYQNDDWKDLRYANAAMNLQQHKEDIHGTMDKMSDMRIIEEGNKSPWDKTKRN